MAEPALKPATQDIVVDEVFPHAPETVWKALTTGELIARWLMEAHGFAPVPVLTARYFDEEVMGSQMLDRLAGELFGEGEPPPDAVMHTELAHEAARGSDGATVMRIRVGPPLPASAGRVLDGVRRAQGHHPMA